MAQSSTDVADHNLEVATGRCEAKGKVSSRGPNRSEDPVDDWALCVVVSTMIRGLSFGGNLAAIYCHGRSPFFPFAASGESSTQKRATNFAPSPIPSLVASKVAPCAFIRLRAMES